MDVRLLHARPHYDDGYCVGRGRGVAEAGPWTGEFIWAVQPEPVGGGHWNVSWYQSLTLTSAFCLLERFRSSSRFIARQFHGGKCEESNIRTDEFCFFRCPVLDVGSGAGLCDDMSDLVHCGEEVLPQGVLSKDILE